MDRKPALMDAARGAGLHPALGERETRPRADARLGRTAGGGSRMVHPEGDRLVAARIVEARPETRAPVPEGARREADGRRQTRVDEVFEGVRLRAVGLSGGPSATDAVIARSRGLDPRGRGDPEPPPLPYNPLYCFVPTGQARGSSQ